MRWKKVWKYLCFEMKTWWFTIYLRFYYCYLFAAHTFTTDKWVDFGLISEKKNMQIRNWCVKHMIKINYYDYVRRAFRGRLSFQENFCVCAKIIHDFQGRLQLRKIIRFSMHDSNQNHKNPFRMSVYETQIICNLLHTLRLHIHFLAHK